MMCRLHLCLFAIMMTQQYVVSRLITPQPDNIIIEKLTCRLTLEELSLRLPEAGNLRVLCFKRAPKELSSVVVPTAL